MKWRSSRNRTNHLCMRYLRKRLYAKLHMKFAYGNGTKYWCVLAVKSRPNVSPDIVEPELLVEVHHAPNHFPYPLEVPDPSLSSPVMVLQTCTGHFLFCFVGIIPLSLFVSILCSSISFLLSSVGLRTNDIASVGNETFATYLSSAMLTKLSNMSA